MSLLLRGPSNTFLFLSNIPELVNFRKVMTNLDSILKSRDITLLTKVHIVKAVVFPVTYRCEIWSTKKAEC